MDPKNMICPFCYHQGMIRNGYTDNGENQRFRCKSCSKRTTEPIRDGDLDIIAENVKLAKQKQKQQDTNRIERKSFREHSRIENAYAEYTKELISVIKEHPFTIEKPAQFAGYGACAGIIQLSDLHFNELINLDHNKYSFEVASKRLRRFAVEAIREFLSNDVSSVLIACTGDLMNSDRRMDELLSNATNRSKATFLAVDLLSQFIGEIAGYFNVTVASVTGNEGRVDKEPGWNEAIATHNYDYTIHKILELRFMDTPVKFIDGDPLELVVDVAGNNILLLHGHSIGAKANLDDHVTKIMGKWSARGVHIHYVIFGHIHAASIGDIYSRSGGLPGANAYSEHGLHLVSRASQNLHILDELGNINGVKVDLQFTTDANYPINEKLAAYNAKSAGKLKEPTVIHSIVI